MQLSLSGKRQSEIDFRSGHLKNKCIIQLLLKRINGFNFRIIILFRGLRFTWFDCKSSDVVHRSAREERRVPLPARRLLSQTTHIRGNLIYYLE